MHLRRGVKVERADGPPRLWCEVEFASSTWYPRLVLRWGRKQYLVGWWWELTYFERYVAAPAMRRVVQLVNHAMVSFGRAAHSH